jgi:hypothetical protein
LHWQKSQKQPTRHTAAKKRTRQEDVDSDYLFGNFLQFPAFRAMPRPRNPSPFSAELPWLERCERDHGAPLNVVIMPNTAQKIVPNNSQNDRQTKLASIAQQ